MSSEGPFEEFHGSMTLGWRRGSGAEVLPQAHGSFPAGSGFGSFLLLSGAFGSLKEQSPALPLPSAGALHGC